jgi:sRNA-binding carbon storage regulator CsrA
MCIFIEHKMQIKIMELNTNQVKWRKQRHLKVTKEGPKGIRRHRQTYEL